MSVNYELKQRYPTQIMKLVSENCRRYLAVVLASISSAMSFSNRRWHWNFANPHIWQVRSLRESSPQSGMGPGVSHRLRIYLVVVGGAVCDRRACRDSGGESVNQVTLYSYNLQRPLNASTTDYRRHYNLPVFLKRLTYRQSVDAR